MSRKRSAPTGTPGSSTDPMELTLVMHMDVSEIFSPPRVLPHASALGLRSGWSMDIAEVDPWSGEKWDLADRKNQARVIKLITQYKPEVLVLSPPCTMFSSLQYLNKQKGSEEWVKKYNDAVELLRFSCLLCEIQARHGRHFVLEHPKAAASWRRPEVLAVMQMPGARLGEVDMCAYNLRAKDAVGEGMVKKPTYLLTNSEAIHTGMCGRCCGSHRHVQLVCGRAAAAARYTPEFCRQLARCIEVEVHAKRERQAYHLEAATAMSSPAGFSHCSSSTTAATTGCSQHGCHNLTDEHESGETEWEQYVDDRTGRLLDPEKVRKARLAEVKTFEGMHAYVKVPRAVPIAKGIKPIATRWLDVDKGGPGKPADIRSRCVVKEIAHSKRDDLFAGTPSLEAFKLMVSKLASSNCGYAPLKRLMVMDVKRAFLHAPVTREIYIELPEEAKNEQDGDVVGKLVKSMYGTRDAPQNWQAYVDNLMRDLGFLPGVAHPCVYHHAVRDIQVVIHVDDFACLGLPLDLHWLEQAISKLVECTYKVLGPGGGEHREASYLNRTLRWTTEGIEYIHDHKHAEAAQREYGMSESKAVATPGTKAEEQEGDEANLGESEATSYRRATATLNYLSQDRPDIAYAVKECARGMARPTAGDSARLKRILRYLRLHPVRAQRFVWQHMPQEVRMFSDADWAGCRKTRRSTSGGVALFGSHLIRAWSRTQATVALSSAESELNALVKASTEALGLLSLAKEMNIEAAGKVLGDSSAAQGIVARRGTGRVKHLRTQQLWVQEAAATGRLKYAKIPRALNYADLLTHHWDLAVGTKMLEGIGFS